MRAVEQLHHQIGSRAVTRDPVLIDDEKHLPRVIAGSGFVEHRMRGAQVSRIYGAGKVGIERRIVEPTTRDDGVDSGDR